MLWIHFNLRCNREIQVKLHLLFRKKVNTWTTEKLVNGAVLTYHWCIPPKPKDSLYVCLDIPAVEEPVKRSYKLSKDTIDQIPREIMGVINRICRQNHIALDIIDYEIAIRNSKERDESQGKTHYNGAPVEEILRFTSVGTKVALQSIKLITTKKNSWKPSEEFAKCILDRLRKELGSDYCWLREAFHFTCNPLLINRFNEGRIWPLFPNRDLKI